MDSSDEDFLPDPERYRKRKEPPDPCEASTSGQRSKFDDLANKQSGLYPRDDFTKGKCSFSTLTVSTCFHTMFWKRCEKQK